jgi:hypothetical protein
VYALGVLLYESLSGYPPVPVTNWQDAAAAHRTAATAPEPDVPGLPRQVRRLCSSCLSHDPGERPTAEHVAQTFAKAAGRPIPAADPHTLVDADRPVPPPGAAYAVGSAKLPHPPTMIDSQTSALPVLPDLEHPRRMPRPLLLGLIGAIVVLGLALVIAITSRPSRVPGQTAQPPGSSAVPTTTTPPPSPTPTLTATTAQGIADELDTIVAAAVAAGRIDSDVAHSLQEEVKNIRESRNQRKLGQNAREMQKKIDELVGDGKIDQQTADQLTTALQPLIAAND